MSVSPTQLLATLLPGLTSSLPHACSRGVNPGVTNQDYRLVRSVSGSLNSSSQELMEKSISLGNNWNSVDSGNVGVTNDPTRGGFALQGIDLPSSPSIARFSSDPGFTERAARFSAFGSGHFSRSFALSNSGSMRSSSQPNGNEAKIAKMSTRGKFASGARGSSDVSGKSQANGMERTVEGEEVKRRLSRSSSAGGSSPQADEGRELSGMERATTQFEPGVTNSSRGQETSGAGADQGRSVATHLSGKKRKSTVDEAVKDGPSPVNKDEKSTSVQSKRSKGAKEEDDKKSKAERSGNSSSSGSKDSKHVDHPKTDYIHVRARRGQATDSHSLAERVRREKISERMKFLQDLVPGCSKVTGKAIMLDEIINYVQSIQRQVESLSMKLAAVTPPTDFNIDRILTKQLQMGQTCALPTMVEHPEACLPYPQLPQLRSQRLLNTQPSLGNGIDGPHCEESTLRRMNSAPMILPRTPAEMSGDGISQIRGLWEGDLHGVVQMGFTQARPAVSLGGFQCDLPPGHMKVEL